MLIQFLPAISLAEAECDGTSNNITWFDLQTLGTEGQRVTRINLTGKFPKKQWWEIRTYLPHEKLYKWNSQHGFSNYSEQIELERRGHAYTTTDKTTGKYKFNPFIAIGGESQDTTNVSEISFSKMLKNKWYQMNEVLKRFHLRGNTMDFVHRLKT